ncbi:MAG: glycosyltransferase [Akkermansiaceae bacterium]|nr:glycosyltransferase [Akkermansiaceae bacterium]
MIRVKYIGCGRNDEKFTFERDGCLFIADIDCAEYDWLVVYDDMPKYRNVGTVRNETEVLACPASHTIFVSQEPPSIKIYPRCFTRQFGHVITTHLPETMPHRNHHQGKGVLHWIAGYDLQEAFSEPDYPKSKLISTVCSAKQMEHTAHGARYRLTRYLADNLSDLEWFGWGVKPLPKKGKYLALNDYKYHIASENYIHPKHWTDKITDPLLALCLTFYAGDPELGKVLPPDSFIPIPLDKPEEALRIIKEAIENNEYEKRLPAIQEARHLLVTKYNFYNQVASVIHEHEAAEREGRIPRDTVLGKKIVGRHVLRYNPVNMLTEAWELLRYKLFLKNRKA